MGSSQSGIYTACFVVPFHCVISTHMHALAHVIQNTHTHHFLECAFMKQTYDFLGQTDLTALSDTST